MKILVIFTGGTIGSTCENGIISPDKEKKYRLLEAYFANGGKAEFDTAQPYTVLSENLNGEHLSLLYKSVKEAISQNIYDGIIVTHGTDTLQYTSAFLSYMLGLCNTPVVLVSSNYPIDNPKANGVDNFTAAVDFISYHNNATLKMGSPVASNALTAVTTCVAEQFPKSIWT